MSGKDGDGESGGGKTVIRPLPGGGFGEGDATPAAPGPQKTVIGGPLPAGKMQGPGQGAPQSPGFGTDWSGGGTSAPTPPPAATPAPTPTPPPAQSGYGADWSGGVGTPMSPPAPATPMPGANPNAWMGAKPADQGFFPSAHSTPQPIQAQPSVKISLDKALAADATGLSVEANPITAAAASLLVLLGRLRSQVVDMQAVPLMNHVTQEIEQFEREVTQSGRVDQQDALVAKYCLCGTADDIVQNIPGSDRAVWLQYSMVARFFNKRTSGVGFFQEVDKALQNPAQKYHLLELMLTCLNLGFEGQYRGQPGGDVKLQEVRRGIYEALRRIRPREDDDVSPRWQGFEIAAKKNFGGTPVWVIAIFALAILTAGYFAMRYLLLDEGDRLTERMATLHPSEKILLVSQVRTDGVNVPPDIFTVEEDETQLERIQGALADKGAQDNVVASTKGDFIKLNINNAVLFASGSADVKAEFADLAVVIAEVLNGEEGSITVAGHTDNVPPSGRGRFKTNQELSVARATAVANKLKEGLTDPDRVVIEGRGDVEPIADNSTREGRAENRRVEILVPRAATLGQGI